MIGFREYLTRQADLEEGIIRKGAVAAYAAQGRGQGNEAVRHYQQVKQATAFKTKKDTDQKVDAIAKALSAMADGLIATRMQIGSVSAQLTAANI